MVVIFVDKHTDNGFGYAAQHHGGNQARRSGSDSDSDVHAQAPEAQHSYPVQYHSYDHHHGHHAYDAYMSAPHGPHGYHQPSQQHRYLLAERYKTKSCRNFMVTGACPYGHRCMFAHGIHELRTTDMNVRDGLMTEEAIRSFQRAMTAYNRGELAQMAQHEQQFSYSSGVAPYVATQPTPLQHGAEGGNATTPTRCECCDCAAAQATHNPYYAAMPPAAALGHHAPLVVDA